MPEAGSERQIQEESRIERLEPGKGEDCSEQKLSLEEAFGRLDELLGKLGDKEVSLDESFGAYAEGTRLLKYCNDYLDQVEKDMLVLNQEGGLDEF